LKGTYNDHLVQLPEQFRADQKLKHIIKGIVQMPLKHRQLWGIDRLSKQPDPVFDTLSVNKCFLKSNLNLPWRSFEPFPCVFWLDPSEKRSAWNKWRKALERARCTVINHGGITWCLGVWVPFLPSQQSTPPVQCFHRSWVRVNTFKEMTHETISVEKLEPQCYLNLVTKQQGLCNISYKRTREKEALT